MFWDMYFFSNSCTFVFNYTFKKNLSIAVNIQSDHMKVIDMKKKIAKAKSQKEIAK